MNCKSISLLSGVLFVISTLFSVTVQGAGGEASDESAIEEIIVTGLKRSETILETPAAISALGAEELKNKGITDISDIQYLVPSLHYGANLGLRNVSIRGVGEFANAPGVMVSVDGVVQAIGTSSQLSQLDLERVEVLRGPQGTLC